MWCVVVVLWLVSPAAGHYAASCGVPGLPAATVTLSDSPLGRINVRYCSPADHSVSRWELVLDRMHQNASRATCSHERLGERRGKMHSFSQEEVQLNLTCTNVCFSRTLDLVYRGCYRLQNMLVRGDQSSAVENSYYYSNSVVNDSDYYTNKAQLYKDFDKENGVTVRWYQEAIPIEEFTVELQRTDSDHEQDALDVTSNCTRTLDSRAVSCELSIALGCYRAYLTHIAPWTSSGLLNPLATTHSEFCHEGVTPPVITTKSSAMGTVTWSLVGLMLLAVSTVGVLLWRVLTRKWLASIKPRLSAHSTPSTELPPLVPAAEPPVRILLLYARECAAGARVANRLRDLLQIVAKDQVYDLYSAETVAIAATAPGEWVRDMMTSPHTRVILLQTPALACMYRLTTPTPHSQLSSPLLGSGAVYATPIFGDSLLALALRLLSEGPPQPMPYLTYYLATLEALHTEALPHVVPFRRYELPCATRRLLADLSSSSSSLCTDDGDRNDKLTAFSEAVDELVEYVRNNENYLADELMFL